VRWPLVRRSVFDRVVGAVVRLEAERDSLQGNLAAAREELSKPQETEPPLTPEETAELWRRFRAHLCQHCRGSHMRACPRVRELSFHPDAKLARVKFWPDGQWSTDGVFWPEDMPPEQGEDEAA
jgi:hypothetical protein